VDSVGALVPFVVIIGAFYLLIIRPSRNRQKAQARLVNQLGVGARVMTTSGLYAQVAGIEDDGTLLLEVAPGVRMRWSKAAVARILPEPDAGDDGVGEPDADADDSTDAAEAAPAASDQESTERPT
jgi:preprotein translocase subunit YajC